MNGMQVPVHVYISADMYPYTCINEDNEEPNRIKKIH